MKIRDIYRATFRMLLYGVRGLFLVTSLWWIELLLHGIVCAEKEQGVLGQIFFYLAIGNLALSMSWWDWRKISAGMTGLGRQMRRIVFDRFCPRGTLTFFRPLTAETIQARIYRVSENHYYIGYCWYRICSLRMGSSGNGWTWIARWIDKNDPSIRRVSLREA